MRLHLLGLPHTVTTDEFSHCAFTGKVKKFSPMMRPLGYELVHYGVEGAQSGANEQIDLMSREEQYALLGHRYDDKSRFHEAGLSMHAPVFVEFNRRLRERLEAEVRPGEIVLNTYGYGHHDGVQTHAGVNIESGIGYPDCYLPFRVYDSYAWQAFQQGKHGWHGSAYEWVVPNYFDVSEWPLQATPQGYVLYFGRICEVKGCRVVSEMARHMPDTEFVLCGQGDPTPYLTSPNIRYLEPVHGRVRAEVLGNASVVLMPTQYIEPFGKVAIEAMLCGTPVLASDHGAFIETITPGVTGYRCRVLHDWISGVALAQRLNRPAIAAHAASRYSLDVVAKQYDAVFQQLDGLHSGKHWYTYPSTI